MLQILDLEAEEGAESFELFSFLNQKYRVRIRSACLKFVAVFVQNYDATKWLDKLLPPIMAMVDEDNSIIQNVLWKNVYFALGKKHPQVWEHESANMFEDALMKCLSQAAYGSATAMTTNLLKFISVYPGFTFEDDEFVPDFFESLFEAHKLDEASQFHRELIGCYYEAIAFLVLKRVKEDEHWVQIETAIKLPLKTYITNYEKINSPQEVFNTLNSIPARVVAFLEMITARVQDAAAVERIQNYVFEVVTAEFDEWNAYRVLKAMVGKQRIAPLLTKCVDALITQLETTELGAKTVQGLAQRAMILQKLITRMHNTSAGRCDCTRFLGVIQGLLKNVQETSKRAAKVLSQQAKANLGVMEAQLSISALVVLHGEKQVPESAVEIFSAILSEVTPLSLKIALPRGAVKELRVKKIECEDNYLNFLKSKGSQVFAEFIKKALEANILQTHDFLGKVLELNLAVVDEEVILGIVDALHDQLSECSNASQKSYIIWVQRRLFSLDILPAAIRDRLKTDLISCVLPTEDDDDSELDKAWEVFKDFVTKKEAGFVDFCVAEFKSRLALLIKNVRNDDAVADEGIIVEKRNSSSILEGSQSIEFASKYCKFLKDFGALISTEERQELIVDIVLDEANFQNCDKNVLALKVFSDVCLAGGAAFDIGQLWQKGYAWLAFHLLNAGSNASLACLPELKRKLLIYVDAEVMPSLMLNLNEDLLL